MISKSEKQIVYILLCLGCITIAFNVAAIAAAIPVIGRDLVISDMLVAKMIPYYMIPYGLGALIYAPLTKRITYRRAIGVSMFIYAFSCFFAAHASSIGQVLFARVMMGFSGASVVPLGLMLIGEFYGKSIRGRLVGIFFSCNFFSSLLGVAMGGAFDWRWLFIVPALLAGLVSLGCLLIRSKILDKKHQGNVNYLQAFSNAKIRNVFIFIAIISALYHGVHKWFGVYLSQVYQLDKLTISYFFILAAIGGFCGQLLGGVISDKKGRLTACYIGFILLGVMTMALAGQYHFMWVALIMALISMGWTISHNGISTALTDYPDEDRPSIASLNSSVRFIMGGIGFNISRMFVEKSFSMTFFGIGILMLVMVFFIKYVITEPK